MSAAEDTSSSADRRFMAFAAALTLAVVAFLGWLLMLRHPAPGGSVDLHFLPAVNAGLNSLASCFLVAGFIAIRRGQRSTHKYLMLSALTTTTLFLISYVTYHSVHGDTPYPKDVPLRVLYLGILISHVLLSMILPFLALVVLWLALRGSFARHRRLARVTLPIWLYVSVTGVLIFVMLARVT